MSLYTVETVEVDLDFFQKKKKKKENRQLPEHRTQWTLNPINECGPGKWNKLATLNKHLPDFFADLKA